MGIYINGFSSVNVERQFNLTDMNPVHAILGIWAIWLWHGIHNNNSNKHQKYVFL